MTKPYDKSFLEIAMTNLGEAFCYARDFLFFDLDEFMTYFISSGVAKEFERGNPAYVFGRSGFELVLIILDKMNVKVEIVKDVNNIEHFPSYWCGYVLAYFQYMTGLSFQYIHSHISMKKIMRMYYPLHEASEDKFVDVLLNMLKKNNVTNIQQRRHSASLSQSQLAEKADINLRTLQQYETGAKDINKASAITLYKIAKVLDCQIEDLLELPIAVSW